MTHETDKTYAVVITDAARAAIREQFLHIRDGQRSPQNAAEWLDRVWTAIDGLEYLPKRHGLAEEDGHVPYEVRRVILDSHLILFTVDEPWSASSGSATGPACLGRTTCRQILSEPAPLHPRPLSVRAPGLFACRCAMLTRFQTDRRMEPSAPVTPGVRSPPDYGT